MALDATHVYWTATSETDQNHGVVLKVPKAGGAPVVLADSERSPIDIAVDNENVYWTQNDADSLRKMAKSGGEPVTVVSNIGWLSLIALDDSSIYVTNSDIAFNDAGAYLDLAAPGILWRVPKKGGVPEKLADMDRPPGDIAVSGGKVIWLALRSINYLRDGNVRTLAVSQHCDVGLRNLAVDDASAYAVLCKAKSNANIGEQCIDLDSNKAITAIAWDGSDDRTLAVDKEFFGPLAVDQAYVYFSARDQNSGLSKLLRVPKAGGEPEVLATLGDSLVFDIVADDSGVYVVADRDIVKLARIP